MKRCSVFPLAVEFDNSNPRKTGFRKCRMGGSRRHSEVHSSGMEVDATVNPTLRKVASGEPPATGVVTYCRRPARLVQVSLTPRQRQFLRPLPIRNPVAARLLRNRGKPA